jgi:nitrile hydratase subunit alpha
MERRTFLGSAAAGIAAGATITVAPGQSEAHTAPDMGHHHSHGDAGSPSFSLLPSDPALRVKAMETLLLEKGLIDAAAVDALIDQFEHRIGPKIGAGVIAKAWTDAEFKQSLLADASKVLAGMGITGLQAEHVVAVENTDSVHNVVVCTLCSCYPWALLGLGPSWYKSEAYRSRVVREPRKVLAEFGIELPPEVEVRVWDSTAEVRYLVVPQRPKGTEPMSEAELAALVTRDSMIGTGIPKV